MFTLQALMHNPELMPSQLFRGGNVIDRIYCSTFLFLYPPHSCFSYFLNQRGGSVPNLFLNQLPPLPLQKLPVWQLREDSLTVMATLTNSSDQIMWYCSTYPCDPDWYEKWDSAELFAVRTELVQCRGTKAELGHFLLQSALSQIYSTVHRYSYLYKHVGQCVFPWMSSMTQLEWPEDTATTHLWHLHHLSADTTLLSHCCSILLSSTGNCGIFLLYQWQRGRDDTH